MYCALHRAAFVPLPSLHELTVSLTKACVRHDSLPPHDAIRAMRRLQSGAGVYATRVHLVLGALLAEHAAGQPVDPTELAAAGLADFEVDVVVATLAARGVGLPACAVPATITAPVPEPMTAWTTAVTPGEPDAPTTSAVPQTRHASISLHPHRSRMRI